MVKIEIVNNQKTIPIYPHQIKKITREVLSYEGVCRAQLVLVFVTDRKIQSLNRQFLARDHATDVLAFDYSQKTSAGTALKRRRTELEGEVIISAVTAVRQSREYQTPVFRELVLYLVHGLLHLRGYDDHHPPDASRMRGREMKVMNHLESRGFVGSEVA